jgi:DNA-binding XRE family transcriptional regulator
MTDALDRMIEGYIKEHPESAPLFEMERQRTAFLLPFVHRRRELGWTQRDLARESGVAQPVIARFECGITDPKISTLRRLADALNLDLSARPHAGQESEATVRQS